MDVWVDSGARLTLDKGQVLGSGVSGTVYAHPTDSSLCLKIYHPTDAAANAPKVRAMLARVPDGIVDRRTQRHQAAWPLEAVKSVTGDIGFVMPRVDFGSTQSLTSACNLAETDDVSRRQLLVAAANIVSLVANMHRAGHHLIDFNPENFRVDKTSGVLTLVDCDGFQISEPGGRRFDAPAAWIDHVAPRFIEPDGSPNIDALNANGRFQDSWGCSVLIFRLLNRNILPFDGIPKPGMAGSVPSENPARARDCSRLYPYGRTPSNILNPLTLSLHRTFPSPLRSAFDRCFANEQPMDAVEWRVLLTDLLSNGQTCRQNANHFALSVPCEQCGSAMPMAPVPQAPTPAAHSPLHAAPHMAATPVPAPAVMTPVGAVQTNTTSGGLKGWLWLVGLGVVGLFILTQCVNRPGSTPSAGQTVSATSVVVTQPMTSAYAPAPAQAPPPERCEDKAVLANASLGGLICNDQDLLSLNNTDKALHEERIQTEGESRRGKIETDRAALEGLMATCGAFGPQRDCLIKMLSGDIAQLRGLIAADRGQTAPSAPSGDSSVAPPPTLPPGGTVVAPAMNDPAWSEPVRLIPGYRFNSTLPNGGHAYALCHVIATGNWVDCANLPSLNGSDYVHYKSADPNNSVIVGYSYSAAGQN